MSKFEERSEGDPSVSRGVPGWALWLVLCSLATVVCLLSFLVEGGEAGLHAWVRESARFSTAYFGTAFAASSLHGLWPRPWTTWLRGRRRAIGLSFAWVMTVHLAGIAALAVFYPDPFLVDRGLVTWLGGGTAYFFIYALAFTSSDRAQRMLGLSAWRRLHKVGSWVIWIVFTETLTLGVIMGDRSRLVPALFMWMVAALRLFAYRR